MVASPTIGASRTTSLSCSRWVSPPSRTECSRNGVSAMDLQLNDKTALVTGATAGIGLAIARKLAVEGAKVIIAGRSEAKLDEAVDSIRIAGGAQVYGVLADPTTAEGAATVVNAVPVVDILVNNLGIYEIKEFVDVTDDDWRRYFEVN